MVPPNNRITLFSIIFLFFLFLSNQISAQESFDVIMSSSKQVEDYIYSSEEVIIHFVFDKTIDPRSSFFNPKNNRGFSAFMNNQDYKGCTVKSVDSNARKISVTVSLPVNQDGQKSSIMFRFQDRERGIDKARKLTFVYRKPRLFLFSAGQQYDDTSKKLSQQADVVFKSCVKNPSILERYVINDPPVFSLDESASVLSHKIETFSQLKSYTSDIALVYFKGHGINTDGRFSYCTTNGGRVDVDNMIQMVSSYSIRNTPVFLFVDACYSGAIKTQLDKLKGDIAPVHFYMGAGPDDVKQDDGLFAERLSMALSKDNISNTTLNQALFPVGSTSTGGYICYPKASETVICSNPQDTRYLEQTKDPSKLTAVLFSLFPGGGQYYKMEYLKGALVTSGAVGTGIGAIVCESMRSDCLRQATQTYDVDVINSLTKKASNLRIVSTVCVISAGVIYVLGILDAAINTSRPSQGFQVSNNGFTYVF